MFQTKEAIDLTERYQSGQRDFRDYQLRRSDLCGINLSNTDFRGVDLSHSNLRNVNFSGADLRDAYLNEADLTGANLTGANLGEASLIKVYLIKTNCYNTNFSGTYLTGAYLTKSKFKEARFNGAYLNGTKLGAAEFIGAYYDKKTKFDSLFDPQKAKMLIMESEEEIIEKPKKITNIQQPENHPTNITIKKFLSLFNHLTEVSHRYLGKTMTKKYLESSRPLYEWLDDFTVTPSTEVIYTGTENSENVLTSTQLKWCQVWIANFIKNCSRIVQNYPKMVDAELVHSFISVRTYTNNTEENSSDSMMIKSHNLGLISV